MGALAIQAAADSATAGRFWLLNPTGSTVRIYLLKVSWTCQQNSVLVTATAPRFTLERMTHTTATGAGVTPVAALSGAPAATAIVRTFSSPPSGPAAVGAFHAFLPSAALTAVGAVAASEDDFEPDEPVELTAGQGMVCRQAEVGVTSDTRRFAPSAYWIEV